MDIWYSMYWWSWEWDPLVSNPVHQGALTLQYSTMCSLYSFCLTLILLFVRKKLGNVRVTLWPKLQLLVAIAKIHVESALVLQLQNQSLSLSLHQVHQHVDARIPRIHYSLSHANSRWKYDKQLIKLKSVPSQFAHQASPMQNIFFLLSSCAEWLRPLHFLHVWIRAMIDSSDAFYHWEFAHCYK